jgi:glycerol-3-phosphate dehydrogenase
MNREHSLQRLGDASECWDILVIGGGATGLGVAVDAAARGYRTALVEQHDFAKGTSSRSTKLAHGGVRYLRSMELGLVRGALRERGLMLRNAPHLVRRKGFIIPVYRWLDLPFYGVGLKAYEWLSGSLSLGASRVLSARKTIELLPTVRTQGLRGGILYFDGQFDDARMALALAQTADAHGAAVVNYARVAGLLREGTRVAGASVIDEETGAAFTVRARVVVNASGIFTDSIRQMDDAACAPMMAVSSGVHLALDRSFLPGDHALMIPKTTDGRVLFAVPWQGHVILGTTDEGRPNPELEPAALESEIRFLIDNAASYLSRAPARADIRSVFTGLRPLVRHGSTATKSLSRDHVIVVSGSGLVTITGGKWTSYRKMAQDTVDSAAESAGLEPRSSPTASLPLWGAQEPVSSRFAAYGTDAQKLEELATDPDLAKPLHPRLPHVGAEVIWAARSEMARSVDDVLSRRTRILQLDAAAANEAAPRVASLLARELGRSSSWEADQVASFRTLAARYLP